MRFEYNLSFPEIFLRHFLGMMIAILSGILTYYVSPFFLALTIFSPILILTGILGWCPIYSLMHINHGSKME